jgi:DNA-binding response OmpR family regulator
MKKEYKILVVDDEKIEREILISYLKLGGYEIDSAENGQVALDFLKDNPVDCILLDVQMPVMDGFQTIKRLKSDPALSSIPVVFLTSMDRSTLQIRGLELGAVHYVIKPYNKAVLLATVKSVLRAIPVGKSYDMEGQLKDFPLPELLQSLDMGHKTAKISLLDGEGVIYLDKGLIEHVSFRNYEGEDAFLRLLIFSKGKYGVTFQEKYDGELPHGLVLISLLMDSTRIYDEMIRLLSSLGESQINIRFVAHEQVPDVLLNLEVSTLESALNSLHGTLEENLRILVELKKSKLMFEIIEEENR